MITKTKQNNNVEPDINHTLLDFVWQSDKVSLLTCRALVQLKSFWQTNRLAVITYHWVIGSWYHLRRAQCDEVIRHEKKYEHYNI